MSKKVVVAMSGGVDSSVAALLLKNEGYEVIGVTMQIWPQPEEKERACCSLDAINDAQRVAWKLDIPHYVMNFRQEFEEKVINDFCDEYLQGRTPNPCIACNRWIKFDSLLNKAKALGAEYIATGHYCRREYSRELKRWLLKTGLDDKKDQSYALYHLTQYQLKHTLFPLGGFRKEEIRDLARREALPVAEKAESQEICFVDSTHGEFLEQYRKLVNTEGDIIDSEGKVLGKHKGIYRYTIGQHKGLGLALGYPVYVTRIDSENNVIEVGHSQELFDCGLIAEDIHFISGEFPAEPLNIQAKIRYNARQEPAKIMPPHNGIIKVFFSKPQRAITPGQAVVFYQGEVLLGGGKIKQVITEQS